jgi:ankyrin repeat protein
LHYAAWDGDVDKAKELIEAGAEVDVQNNNSITPLH